MDIDVCQLSERNVDLLYQLDEDIFDEKIDLDRLTAYLKEQSHIMVVATSKNVVIGQVLAVVHRHPDKPTELYIDDLAVSETLQRKGIATLMLNKIFSIGVERGCEEVWVATEPDNKPAKAFYKSLNLPSREAVIFEGKLHI